MDEITSNNQKSMPNSKLRKEFNFSKSYYIMALALILLVIFGGNAIITNKKLSKATRTINDIYSKSFLELADSVNEIDIYLAKGAVSNSPEYLSELASKIYMQSSSAINSLGQLPVSHIELDNTAKFLSQVGDYTYVISKKAMSGEGISDKEKDELSKLSYYADSLSDKLYELEDQMFKNGLSFENIDKGRVSTANAMPDLGTNMQKIEENFQDYPSLIYDGPFSDHINRQTAIHLSGRGEITREEAEEKIKNFPGIISVKSIAYSGETKGTIPTFKYNVTDSDNKRLSIEVSKQGGMIVNMLKNRNVPSSDLSVQDAIKKGGEYLIKCGIHSMKESYYEIKNNIITINYAYVENGIIMYPDLVKIKIAMDNGEMLGFESQGYLMSHTENRELNPVNVFYEQAKELISPVVTVTDSNMAVIPKEGGREVLCYEFITTLNDKKFIIYINATNGAEEQILMLIENNDGVLTL